MYLEQKNYNKQTINELVNEQQTDFAIVNGGYPVFNICDHTTLDMSHLNAGDKENWMHTLSIKLDNDRYVTVCVMKPSKQDEQVCLDIRYSNGETRAMSFKNGTSQELNDIGLIAVINEIK